MPIGHLMTNLKLAQLSSLVHLRVVDGQLRNLLKLVSSYEIKSRGSITYQMHASRQERIADQLGVAGTQAKHVLKRINIGRVARAVARQEFATLTHLSIELLGHAARLANITPAFLRHQTQLLH